MTTNGTVTKLTNATVGLGATIMQPTLDLLGAMGHGNGSGATEEVAVVPGYPGLVRAKNYGDPADADETKIAAAITAAAAAGYWGVLIDDDMLPYDASLVTFSNAVHMFRAGGSLEVAEYDVTAYGAAGNGTNDDYQAVLAAFTASQTNSGTLVFPGGQARTYHIGTTIDFTGVSNQHWIGRGVSSAGTGANLSYPPRVKLNGATPLLSIPSGSQQHHFENFYFQGGTNSIRAVNTQLLRFENCSFGVLTSTATDNEPVILENCFLVKFLRCGFNPITTAVGKYGVTLRGIVGGVATTYLVDFIDCIFAYGAVLHEQNATPGETPGKITFERCLTEFSKNDGLFITFQGTSGEGVSGLSFRDCWSFDSTCSNPNTIVWDNSSAGTALKNVFFLNAGSLIRVASGTPVLEAIFGYGNGVIITDSSGNPYSSFYGTLTRWAGFDGFAVSHSADAAIAPAVGSYMPLRTFVSGESYARFGVNMTGSLHWGTGSAGFDTNLSRHYSATTTWDPASVSDGQSTTKTVTVTGAALGDVANASFSNDLQGLVLTAYVSSANVVTAVLSNTTGGAIDLAPGTIRVAVSHYT